MSNRSDSLRELFLWSLPALLAGALLRLWILQGWGAGYYFGPDSATYWHPVFRFFHDQPFSISEKRPWLYPCLMLLAPLGPKSPAFTAALLQHLLGLLATLPLAAVLRMTLPRWRLWVIPLTLAYALSPQMLYWEHVLISDSLFTSLTLVFLWAFCRFWHSQKWGFLAGALFLGFLLMATRPVGRALWLGLIPLSLLIPATTWRQKGIILGLVAGLYFPASHLTRVNQGNSLLFASVFPLIETGTPLHSQIKKELEPSVKEARADLWGYVSNDQKEIWTALFAENAPNFGPAYTALAADHERRAKVTQQIAREALLHHPFTYGWMVAMKIYAIGGLNTRSLSFNPRTYRSGSEKFLNASMQKIDPAFPAFLLNNPQARDKAGISAALEKELASAPARERVLWLLPKLGRVTSLYSWEQDHPWPKEFLLLLFFLAGIISVPFVRERRNFLPILFLGLGYLALTLVVGRAVERYRLPAEFLLLILTFQGFNAVLGIVRGIVSRKANNALD